MAEAKPLMGLVLATVVVRNPSQPTRPPVTVEALVDSGALHLCLPEAVCTALGLEAIDQRAVSLADGSTQIVPYVGPVELRVLGRVGICGALVLGDQALLGVIPLEDLDLVIVPKTRTLAVNPQSPQIGRSLAK
jgi:clan AA aspartic protease